MQRVKSKMHRKHIPDLPTELVLLIQSYLPLTTLVAARGVCRVWRSLIPGAHIPPARRRLLELYLQVIRSPAFLASRREILPHLQPFNRKRLLAHLPPFMPEEFRCWVLEWPARAALGQIWPGLRTAHRQDSPPMLHKDRGMSLLYRADRHILNGIRLNHPIPGCMETVFYKASEARGPAPVPACGLLLDDACVEGWQRSRVLVLWGTCDGVDLAGRVYQVDGVRCRLDEPFAESWVAFLRQELVREEAWLREHGCSR